MIGDIFELIEAVLILVGSLFILLAAIGILRLPDIYTRMHSASKAGPVGAGFILLALAIDSGAQGEVMRALAAILFLLLTAPLAAHLLAKASYAVGYSLWGGSVLDEMPDMSKVPNEANAPGRAVSEFHTGPAGETLADRARQESRGRWSDLRRP